MAVYSIDANQLMQMFFAGAANLEAKKEWINELNVFPVPDGDTGTNMTMTIMSASREVQKLTEIRKGDDFKDAMASFINRYIESLKSFFVNLNTIIIIVEHNSYIKSNYNTL